MNRFGSVRYDDVAGAQHALFMNKFRDIELAVLTLVHSRERAIVLTKLEEAHMWIGKAIREEQLARETIQEAGERSES